MQLFKKYLISTTIITIILLGIGSHSFAKVYIDIDSPTFRKFPIAIVEFQKLRPLLQKQEDLSNWFADGLSKPLDMTGYFNIINKKAFLEDQTTSGINVDRIHFTDWSTIGAEYLVKGGFSYKGQQLEVEMRLFDVIKEEILVSKRYTGTRESANDMIKQFAAEILLALTGDKGVFDTKIAFIARSRSSSDVYTIDFDGSGLTKLTSNRSIALALRWSPDGRMLSFTSYRDGSPDLYIYDVGRRNLQKVAGFDGINLGGGWLPDSRKLLLTLSKDGNEEIYVMDVKSRLMTRLTYNFAIDVSATWSPDGQRIAFVSDRAGSPQIYIMDADGNNVRRLTYDGKYNTSPTWSPRGKTLAFEGMVGGRYQIFTIDENGANLRQLTFEKGDNESPSWSPDGRFIVFSSRGRGIFIINADGSNIRSLYGSGNSISPFWSSHLQ
jgi:TolB protein